MLQLQRSFSKWMTTLPSCILGTGNVYLLLSTQIPLLFCCTKSSSSATYTWILFERFSQWDWSSVFSGCDEKYLQVCTSTLCCSTELQKRFFKLNSIEKNWLHWQSQNFKIFPVKTVAGTYLSPPSCANNGSPYVAFPNICSTMRPPPNQVQRALLWPRNQHCL